MPDYTTLEALRALIPEPFLTEGLDDDHDGVVDAWPGVLASITIYIDGVLSVAYSTPFDPVPKVVSMVALTLAAEAVFARRDIPADKNPHTNNAKAMRDLLLRIAKGDVKLSAASPEAAPVESTAEVIMEPSRLGSRMLG
jgi:phage gp36-like protein